MGEQIRLTRSERTFFGLGAIGNGVVNGAIGSLLLLFYNQAVGLNPALVGLALMISIIADALWDPLIGHWTDNTHTRWGRRHPFMYLAAVPAAVSFYMLFNPPAGWSEQALFFYLLACVMSVRFFASVYEITSSALVPELAPDYDDRTVMWSYRFFFGLLGSLIMITLAYQIFLPAGGGLTSVTGYASYGLASAAIIAAAMLLSTLSVHRWIPRLRPPVVEHWGLADVWKDVSSVLRNRTFVVLMLSGLVSGLGTGMSSSLSLYMNAYFWEIPPESIAILASVGLFASIIGVSLAPLVSRWLGKKRAMITLFWMSLFLSVIPVTLRLLDVLPANGSPVVFAILVIDGMVTGILSLMAVVILVSLLTDVVEDNAAKTGRRTEGLLFAFNGVLQKSVSGVGTFLAGVLLTFVAFPQQAVPGQVDPQILRNLALIYLPVAVTLATCALAMLSLLRVDRAQHDENLRKLGEAPAADAFANPVPVPSTNVGTLIPEGGREVRL